MFPVYLTKAELKAEQNDFIELNCPDGDPRCRECRWEFKEELDQMAEDAHVS